MSKSPADYLLRVRAGPSYDPATHVTVNVNDEEHPVLIDSEHFTGYLVVRVANFGGLTPDGVAQPIPNPQSHYFVGRNRRYSIMLQGRFKKRWTGDDLIFGLDFDSKVRTPAGVGLALRIAKWLDPALDAVLTGDKPCIFSPLVSAMNSLAVYKSDAPEVNNLLPRVDTSAHAMAEQHEPFKSKTNKVQPCKDKSKGKASANNSQNNVCSVSSNSVETLAKPADSVRAEATNRSEPRAVASTSAITTSPSVPIGTWSFHSRMVPENPELLFSDSLNAPPLTAYEKRKKFFADVRCRKEAAIDPNWVYCMDFYDAYFDFNSVSLKLPGFSVNGFKYWDGQPLRFVCKSRDRSAVMFVVSFELVERASLNLPASALRDGLRTASALSLEDPIESP